MKFLQYKMKFQDILLSVGIVSLDAMEQGEWKIKILDPKYTKEKFDDADRTLFKVS